METKRKADLPKLLLKYKYVLLVLLLGLILILVPIGGNKSPAPQAQVSGGSLDPPDFSLADQEARLSAALGDIAGVGQVRVLLSLKSSASRVLAQGKDGALVVNEGSGVQAPVDVTYVYPTYLGATVVCAGADSPAVRLAVTQAVEAFTGLGADKISVIKMK
ncbi:MAG: stage III sporulation protein AG [Firmicutes bacterium]|nr:stage III sporulation protein AG [Bacillota bacterium]